MATASKTLCVIGIMNGTSMDGVDLAMIETDGMKIVEPRCHTSTPYSSEIRQMLVRLVDEFNSVSASEYFECEKLFMEFIAGAVRTFIEKLGATQKVDYIGLHGQTIRHFPEKQVTIRLEDGQRLASLTGIPVVAGLRERDLYNRGQGAPLVPGFHAAIASKIGLEDVVFVNIGGIANVTFVSKEASQMSANGLSSGLLAFDCGPGNALIDWWMKHKAGLEFDPEGEHALAGKINERMLEIMSFDSYFTLAIPKSLDRSHFLEYYKDGDIFKNFGLEDGAATLAAFTGFGIVHGIRQMKRAPTQIILCGGGAKNKAIFKFVEDRLTTCDCDVTTADQALKPHGFTDQSIEAQAFAYLAARSVLGLPITFPNTTGVGQQISGGVLYQP